MNQYKELIPKNTILLQESTISVVLYDYLTAAEVRKLQKKILTSNMPDNQADMKPENAVTMLEVQDSALEALFVEAYKGNDENKEIIPLDNPLSLLDFIPASDGKYLYEYVTEKFSQSFMDNNAKKN